MERKNRGVLFPNKKKTKEKSPDYIGSITLFDGHEYWLSGWSNNKDGKKWMSLSIGDEKKEKSNYGDEEIF